MDYLIDFVDGTGIIARETDGAWTHDIARDPRTGNMLPRFEREIFGESPTGRLIDESYLRQALGDRAAVAKAAAVLGDETLESRWRALHADEAAVLDHLESFVQAYRDCMTMTDETERLAAILEA